MKIRIESYVICDIQATMPWPYAEKILSPDKVADAIRIEVARTIMPVYRMLHNALAEQLQ
jgi:hypothetical protein